MRAVLPPAKVSKDLLLRNRSRQPLDGGASMLQLARLNDRLRPELVQHPTHPAELRRGQREGDRSSGQLDFHAEMALLLLTVFQDDISHNPGIEVRYGRGP